MKDTRLQWYGRIMRRGGLYTGGKVVAVKVPGNHRNGRPRKDGKIEVKRIPRQEIKQLTEDQIGSFKWQ